MRLFKRKEKRAADGTVGIEDCLLSAMLGGNIEVTKAEALQIPTVAACVNLIADRISALPIKLYRENGKEVEEITDDKRLCLLNHDTGDTINASEMKKLWVRDYFLGKGSYTYIERNMYNEPTGLYYVDETRVAIAPNADPIHKTFAINVNGHVYFPYQFLKILRNSKGFGVGTSIIAEDPLALAIFYNTMKFENATIRKGGNKKGYILSKNKLTQDALDKVKEAWRKLYSNSYDTKDNAVVLNDGLDFKESSSTSVELQLNENKRTNAEEICKLFCMPADVLNGKANESMISQFVQNCLMPLINTIESALDRDMLTEAEKIGHYYWAFDTSELTRGDFASRMNAYAVALQNNIYQLDEIREMEDKPPLGFNYIKLGLDSVLLDPKTGEIYTPNTDKTAMMNSGLTNDEVRAILELRERQAVFGEGHRIIGNISTGGGGASSGNKSANSTSASGGSQPTVERPQNEPNNLKQFNVYDPATRTDEERAALINPNYTKGKNGVWEKNCIRAVTAYELSERGYDVVAKAFDPTDALGYDCKSLWNINSNTQYMDTRVSSFKKDAKSTFTKWGDGSRAFVVIDLVDTKTRHDASHVFCAKSVGGKIKYIDPQTGKKVRINSYLKMTKPNLGNISIVRSDNIVFSNLVSCAVENRR